MNESNNKRKRELDVTSDVLTSSLISIPKSDVPEYLQQGEFFMSLNADEDDEVILVPENTLKMNVSVRNCEELDWLLRSLRFWVVVKMVPTIVDYVLRDTVYTPQLKKAVLVDYRKYFGYVDVLWKMLSGGRLWCLLPAVQQGDVELLAYLHETHRFPVNTDKMELVNEAAKQGHISCLKYLHQFGDVSDLQILEAAQSSKSVECFQYAFEEFVAVYDSTDKCLDWTATVCDANIDCYVYAFHNCQPCIHFSMNCQAAALLYNGLKSVQYGLQCGLPLHMEFYYSLCADSLEVVAALFAAGCPLPLNACNHFARKGKPRLLTFALQHGCSHDAQKIALTALGMDNVDCLQAIVEHGCKLTAELFIQAVRSGAYSCVRYLYTNSCPWSPAVFTAAVNNHDMRIMRYLEKRKCPWDVSAFQCAARHGRMDVLKLLFDLHCPWDNSACVAAALHRNTRALQFLRSKGCPWDEREYQAARHSTSIFHEF